MKQPIERFKTESRGVCTLACESLWKWVHVWKCVCVCVWKCVCVCVAPSPPLLPSLALSVSVSLCLCLSVCLSLSPTLPLHLSVSLPPSLSLSPSAPAPLCVKWQVALQYVRAGRASCQSHGQRGDGRLGPSLVSQARLRRFSLQPGPASACSHPRT